MPPSIPAQAWASGSFARAAFPSRGGFHHEALPSVQTFSVNASACCPDKVSSGKEIVGRPAGGLATPALPPAMAGVLLPGSCVSLLLVKAGSAFRGRCTDCLPLPGLLAGRAQLPPWTMNPPARKPWGSVEGPCPVLADDTRGPVCRRLRGKASLPNKESQTAANTVHQDVVTPAWDTWSCSSVS